MKVITKIESTAKPSAIKRRRVAAYCRVSTSAEEQLISLETQKSHYEKFINANPEWEYAGLYYDMYNQRLIQCPACGSVGKWLK